MWNSPSIAAVQKDRVLHASPQRNKEIWGCKGTVCPIAGVDHRLFVVLSPLPLVQGPKLCELFHCRQLAGVYGDYLNADGSGLT